MVSWLMIIKAVLISSGVASVALLLKLSVPLAVDFAPVFWSSLLSWLKPPYLYVITNGIIITIVASSKYYRSSNHHDHEDDGIMYGEDDGIMYGGDDGEDFKIQTETIVHDQGSPRMLVVKDLDTDSHFGFANPQEPEEMVVTAVVYDDAAEEEIESEIKSVIMVENSDLVESGVGDEVLPTVISNRNIPPMIESENLPPTEKPLVSTRLSHRKSAKASPEGGRALRVTKRKKNNDTLENTWKMITEGKSTPLTRQLYRRSDSFGRGDSGGSEAKPVVYKKSETFRDRTNYYQETEKKMMRKEPSLSQDELNRRVEEFIKKTNEEMRLQRMESLRQYKEITSRGV
ncbi:hypothetical protein AALP_AA2G032400 [Arabis alpina]|uniref:DUF4408 domain-containing protein n=1 Tax=Arabis alpina TaxID=50452 RepID=A0A087HF20_ARAAL|nr:hypothetical protein AALP_AA2G032400 [Arabis alpina]